MDLEDVAGQRLVPGGHAADGPGFEHAVAARRDEPAVQRSGQHPADRPDPETILEFVDASDHQRRAGSSRAAKKPTPSSISRSPASIARPRPANSSTPPSCPRPTAWSPARPPQILGDLFDRLGLRRMRAARLGQQPDGLRLELRRVSRSFCHGSIISHRVREMRNKNQFISGGNGINDESNKMAPAPYIDV